MKNYDESRTLFERATRSLAGGVSSHFRASERPHPLFYVRAEGSRIWDVDGNEFLDFTLSQGPMILGHSHPAVIAAVSKALAQGQLFAAQHLAEVELAEALKEFIPCADLVRFSLSGSEAVHGALRLARAYTGRPKYVKFEGHYHGWFDAVSFSVSPAAAENLDGDQLHAVPWTAGIGPGNDQNVLVLPWNDLHKLQEVLSRRAGEIAAVICEPVMCNNGCIPPEPGYLEGLRSACDRHGIVLIFDEIITGFRLGMGGAQSYYNVLPDLAVFGKAMASGFPISAIVGRNALMGLFASGKVMHAGTLNAQNGCVAAALATLRELGLHSPQVYDRMTTRAQALRSALIESATRHGHSVVVQSVGPMFHVGFSNARAIKDYRDTLKCDKAKYGRFCDLMHDRGIRLIGRGLWYLSAAHSDEDIQICAKAADASLAELAPQPVRQEHRG